MNMLSKYFVTSLLLSYALVDLTQAATLFVRPSQSIQSAIAKAKPGDVIKVLPGIYREGSSGSLNAITITKNGIQLVGLSTPKKPVVLENAGGQRYGIWVSPLDTTGSGQSDEEHPPCAFSKQLIDGFSLQGFTVRGFDRHGVHLACTKGFNLSNNIADSNKTYGLFPIVSQQGVVSNNEVKNTSLDAGLYVGQSSNVMITGNTTHDSLIGIELENVRNCTTINNRVYNNTVGIVLDSAPGLTRPSSKNNLISFNDIRKNNRTGTLEGPPSGIGILAVASSNTIIANNQVADNNLSGILLSSRICQTDPTDPTCGDPTFDPTSNNNRITANALTANGTVPNSNPLLDPFRADLSWDGIGEGNCWALNQLTTSVPPSLLSCF